MNLIFEINFVNETVTFYFCILWLKGTHKWTIKKSTWMAYMCSCKRNNYFNMAKQRMCWNQIAHILKSIHQNQIHYVKCSTFGFCKRKFPRGISILEDFIECVCVRKRRIAELYGTFQCCDFKYTISFLISENHAE